MGLQRVRHNLVNEYQQTREHLHDGVLRSYEKHATELDTLMHKEETLFQRTYANGKKTHFKNAQHH